MKTNSSYTVRSRRRGLYRGVLALGLAMAASIAMAVPAGASALPSDYGAGYFAEPSTGFASASATFTVPSVSCTSAPSSESIGLQVQANDEGTVAIDWSDDAVVDVQCNDGTPSYSFDVDSGSNNFVEPGVSAGDVVVASIDQTTTVGVATVHDLTSHYTWVAEDTPFTESGVFWSIWTGAYYYGNSGSWAQFTSIPFSKCQINGDYLTYSSPAQYNYRPSGSVLVRTSALNRAGDGFKLTWN
jgi:hypothetical protein